MPVAFNQFLYETAKMLRVGKRPLDGRRGDGEAARASEK